MMLKTFMALTLGACFALPAAAQGYTPGASARFDQLDRNGDGFISRDEGKDADELHTRFSELDTNNDGKLSRDEYSALQQDARASSATTMSGAGATTRSTGGKGATSGSSVK